MKKKTVFIFLTIVVTMFFVYFGVRVNKRIKWRNYVSCTEYYGEKYSKKIYYSGKAQLWDYEKGQSITPKYDWIATPTQGDSITVYCHDNKRGFLNCFTGKILIKAKYERAWKFSEGLAGVVMDNKLGFIDKTNKLVIPFQYTFLHDELNRVDFLFKKGYCTAIDSTGRHGLISPKGDWKIKAQYNKIKNPINGYRVVQTEGKMGVMDSTLKVCLPIQYDRVEVLVDGLKVVNNGNMRLLSFDGQTILKDEIFDSVENLYLYDSYGYENVDLEYRFCVFKIAEKYGVLTKQGKVIIPALYTEIKMLNPDCFLCTINNSYSILLNSQGIEI